MNRGTNVLKTKAIYICIKQIDKRMYNTHEHSPNQTCIIGTNIYFYNSVVRNSKYVAKLNKM